MTPPTALYNLYMSSEMTVSEARRELADVTNRAEYGGETTYITKSGRRSSAVVSAARAQLLDDLEDLIDGEQVREALAALADGTEERVPYRRRTNRRDR